MLAELDERLGRSPAVAPAPVRARAAARRQAMQTAVAGWARLPEARLGAGEAAKWDVWRLLGALWWGEGSAPGLRQTHPRGLTADDLVALIRKLGQQLANGQPIDAPDWAAALIPRMVARGLHKDAAAGKIAGWLAELESHGLLFREIDIFRVERFRPGGVFGQMLARAPPQAVEALWRNPLGVAGVGVAGLATGEQAAAVQAWLRGVVLAWGQVERGLWRAVPLRLRAWRVAGEVRRAVKAGRLALIDVANTSEALASGVAAGVTGAELAGLVKARDDANLKLAQVVGAARDMAAARGLSVHRVRNVGVQPLLLVEGRVYMPIVPAMLAAAVTWALGFGPAWGALWLPLWFMFPHMKTARTEGSKPGLLGYVKSIRWERAWMLAASVPLFEVPLWSWAATGFLTVELVGVGGLLAGFLSTSMSRGRREEPENRMKWPFTSIPDARLWLRVNVFGLLAGPFLYTFWQYTGGRHADAGGAGAEGDGVVAAVAPAAVLGRLVRQGHLD